MSLFTELRRRNVFRVAAAYLVASWLLIEASSLILDIYQAPIWVSQVIVALLAIGFPVALIFSWAFEMTPDGLKRESEITPDASYTAHAAKKLDVAVIVLLVSAISLFGAERIGLLGPGAAEQVASAAVARTTDEQPRAIAVLPFTDMSPGGDQGYFADGIAEEILNLLAKNRQLRVVARTSAFQFRDAADMRAVGAALDADRILEGSVRTAGTRVRITAQLIEAETGYHIWSETYDRDLTDIFAVQDEIAGAITEQLGAHLGVVTSAQAEVGTDVDAYRLYLQGRQAFNERAAPGRLQDSIDLLTRAVEADPKLAVAHGALALSWSLSPWYTRITQADALRKAVTNADRALASDPENVEAMVAKGYSLAYLGMQPSAGLDWLNRALELRPNDVTAVNLRGDLARLLGISVDARQYESYAIELDPLNAVHHWDYGWTLIEDGDPEAALTPCERASALEPRNWFSKSCEVWALLLSGHPEESRERLERYEATGDYDAPTLIGDRLMVSLVLDDDDTAAESYRQAIADFEALDVDLGIQAFAAYIYGDFDRASELVRRAVEVGDLAWLTFAFTLGMSAEMEEAGVEFVVSPRMRDLQDMRASGDWAQDQRLHRQLVELRDAYRTGGRVSRVNP